MWDPGPSDAFDLANAAVRVVDDEIATTDPDDERLHDLLVARYDFRFAVDLAVLAMAADVGRCPTCGHVEACA